MKRFFRYKRGQRLWVGTTVLTKTGFLGCADIFGNLYLTFPWAKFRPAEGCKDPCRCQGNTPEDCKDKTP